MTDALKLTPTMLAGLQKMALKLQRQSSCLTEPNENTGKALALRGLIKKVNNDGGWNRYIITPAGIAALAAHKEQSE